MSRMSGAGDAGARHGDVGDDLAVEGSMASRASSDDEGERAADALAGPTADLRARPSTSAGPRP